MNRPSPSASPPELAPSASIRRLEKPLVRAAGEGDALRHRRRGVDPRHLMIHPPDQLPGRGVHRVEKAVARPEEDPSVGDGG
jgi:hypothetical protein